MAEFVSLEGFQTWLHKMLDNLIHGPFSMEGWTRWSVELPSNLSCSMVLWNLYKKVFQDAWLTSPRKIWNKLYHLNEIVWRAHVLLKCQLVTCLEPYISEVLNVFSISEMNQEDNWLLVFHVVSDMKSKIHKWSITWSKLWFLRAHMLW